MICPRCKAALPNDVAMCNKCGMTFQYRQPYQQPYPQQVPPQQYQQSVQKQGHSGLSIAALILSIIGVTSIIGLILGIVDVSKKDGRKKTLSFTAIGISMGWLLIVAIIGDLLKGDTTTAQKKETEYIYVVAKDAAKEFNDNQVSCKDNYDGKMLLIYGKIEDIGTDIADQSYITLDTGKKYSLDIVQCYFDDSKIDYVKSLKKGEEVYLIGKGDIGSFKFKVDNCKPASDDIIEKYKKD